MTEKGGERSGAERDGVVPVQLRGVWWLYLFILFSWRRAGRERQEEVRRISLGEWGGLFPKGGGGGGKKRLRGGFSRVSFGLVLVRGKRAVQAVRFSEDSPGAPPEKPPSGNFPEKHSKHGS